MINTPKPFSESCEQNKQVILTILRQEFEQCQSILEIGSGTGQHAVFFAEQLPHLMWQPSDQSEYIPGIQQWVSECEYNNVISPIELNVTDSWPQSTYSGIFSANTAHIMGWSEVELMFEGVGKLLETGSPFCLYGPFNYNKQYTSASNANFDIWLKSRNPKSAIRNFEDLIILAEKHGLKLISDYEMPANNRILVWQKNK